jgi:hypothetical protein
MARTTDLAQQSLRLGREMGAKVRIAECLERLAFVACKLGCPALAAERLGSATALREMLGVPIEPRDREVYESITRQICHQLGEDHFRAAWKAGQERPLDQVIVESLSEEVHEHTTSINP